MSFSPNEPDVLANENPSYRKALIHISNNEIDSAKVLLESVYFENSLFSERALQHLFFALDRHGRGVEAIELLEDACKRYPHHDKWPEHLASLWMRNGDLQKAVIYAQRALEINPDNSIAFINKICWLAGNCDNPELAREMFESWGQRFMDPWGTKAPALRVADLEKNRRLRVGYVSGDLRNHSVRYFIEPFFRGHDRRQFEVHAFMTMDEDEVTEFIKPHVDQWHSVKELTSEDLLNLIRDQKIDILVDLSGHTEGERLAVFAMRAAPVQVTWFGFMQTLGMKAMDWRLTDWGTSPAGSDSHYTEKLYRLNCMVAYGPPVGCETLYPSPYHHHDFVTMVSLNHTRKISDQALNVWRQILVQNPNAGLIIISSFSDPEIAEKSLRPRLTNAGLPMQQVSISPKLTMRQFMSLASVADFALDSFPISGGTSTLHSLWMGLPVLALNDPQFGSRSTSSATTLKGLDLNDCVADTFDQYLNIACQWIQNPSMLDALRQRCRPALEQSPLMSHSQRVQEVESAYRHMWHQFVDKQTLVPKERTP